MAKENASSAFLQVGSTLKNMPRRVTPNSENFCWLKHQVWGVAVFQNRTRHAPSLVHLKTIPLKWFKSEVQLVFFAKITQDLDLASSIWNHTIQVGQNRSRMELWRTVEHLVVLVSCEPDW